MTLSWEIDSAQDRVFTWLHTHQYGRDEGSVALADYGDDWVEAWQNWWDEGDE